MAIALDLAGQRALHLVDDHVDYTERPLQQPEREDKEQHVQIQRVVVRDRRVRAADRRRLPGAH